VGEDVDAIIAEARHAARRLASRAGF
jgi:hypothetical protein